MVCHGQAARAERAMSRAEHMLLSLRGARWKETTLAFFTVNIDDSGTSPSQQVAIGCALIIPASHIVSLENTWERLKAKEHFSCFHMSEFAALNSKSEFSSWSGKQRRVAAHVRRVIKKYGVKACSFSVKKDDYDELMPDEMKKYAGRYHYTWAIRHVLVLVEQWIASSDANEPLEFVFDSMGKRTDPRRLEVEAVMEEAEEVATHSGHLGRFKNYGFRDRCDLAALQCTDILAWTCYQASLWGFTKKPMTPLGTAMWNDFNKHLNGKWLHAVTVKREHLKDWIDRELADGRALARFRAREEARKNQGT